MAHRFVIGDLTYSTGYKCNNRVTRKHCDKYLYEPLATACASALPSMPALIILINYNKKTGKAFRRRRKTQKAFVTTTRFELVLFRTST